MQTVSSMIQKNKKDDLERELMASLKEELSDPVFQAFVSKLNLPYEQLCKYTSILKTSAVEWNHCEGCKGLAMCQNNISGFAYLPQVKQEKLTFCYKACRFQKQFEEQTSYQKNVSVFELPKEIKEASMKQIYTTDKNRFEAIKSITEFKKNYPKETKGLYLYGSFGSGKTYLVAALFNEFAKEGVRSSILFWPEFLRDLKSSFGTDFKEKVEQVKKVPLLLIDDIGAESATPWSRDDILCPLLQYRMQEHLPTFFTSNFDYEALEQHFSTTKDGVEQVKAKRLMERIKQLSELVPLISKNLRS